LGFAAVLTPSLQDLSPILKDSSPRSSDIAGGETLVHRQAYRVEPELARRAITARVHMRRLVTVEAVEEEPQRTGNPGDGRHGRRNMAPPERLPRIPFLQRRSKCRGYIRDVAFQITVRWPASHELPSPVLMLEAASLRPAQFGAVAR
jgi:hypothetical protein